jgi:hypothetical protein
VPIRTFLPLFAPGWQGTVRPRRSGGVENCPCSAGMQPWQYAASHFTDWAARAYDSLDTYCGIFAQSEPEKQPLLGNGVWTSCHYGITAMSLSLSLSLMLRPKVSRPVCLGIKHPSGAYDQVFISVRNTECVWQLRSWFLGSSSLTRGRVCLLYVPLALASAVFLGP